MPKKGRKSLIVIDLVDDKDISTIVLDDDDDNNSDMTSSLVMIDDDSIVNINDDDDDSTVNINDDDSTVNINDSDATVNINDNDATVNINDDDSTVNINDDATLNINDDDSTVNINDDTLNTTVDSPQKQLAKSDNCDVMTVDDSMVSSNKPKEKSNISEKSVGDEGDIVIEVFNKNQQDRSSKDDEKVVGNEESSKASGVNEDGEKVGTQCRKKRRRRTKCTVSETGAKKAKIDNNTESKGVLSNSDANLVTDEATKLAEAKSGPVLSSRIGKKKLRQRKHLLFQQRKLCKALKRSLVNDSSNLESCLEFLNSSPNGGGKKKGNNVENGGDKEKINDSEGVEEKNDSVDVTEDDDVILVSSSESVCPSQSKPVDVSRFKGLDIWKRPAHLSPNPVSRAIVQQMVNQLSKNKNLLGWTPSSYAQVVANSQKLLSNSANLSQWCAHKSSQSGLKSEPISSSQWGAHKSRSGLNSGQNSSKWCEHKSQSGLKSGPSSSQWCVHKSSQSGLNCGPMLLNVVAGTTKSSSQDAVTVVDDDDDKVVAQPVTSELSLVGNNMFVPSSMPARKGPRPVFIDGCNVAFSHGKNATFSVRGIEICVEYFRRLGNRAFVVLPNHRKGHLSDATLRAWESDGTLIVTPSRRMDHSLVASDDDRYVIQCAAAMDGVIVTKDQYRDHMGINPLWDKTIKNRLLILTWLQDILIFPDDPLGRHGPKLKDFLMY